MARRLQLDGQGADAEGGEYIDVSSTMMGRVQERAMNENETIRTALANEVAAGAESEYASTDGDEE